MDLLKEYYDNLKSNNSKSPEWNAAFKEIGKFIHTLDLSARQKYKLMLYLKSFEFLGKESGVYYFGTTSESYKKYINSYNNIFSEHGVGIVNISFKEKEENIISAARI